ncbi:hypothetical protein CH253_03885 [Rhodococcus sp. 06-156-3C]|uniref:protein adenylyltransferase SelO n=1 Tax=Nocardiaceae TaxID=85025 RepID=UPI0005230C0C|nr:MULTISPECIES: YdiU family protein [Rhodococcus]OZD17733.1 hypothetical protein CH280_07860 [Rhodococcus sp. 06-156-4C]OZD21466.1 hypothetical protein CH248_10160 [Rhodococcus sp. 06-156-4a]OZD23987.1 hypothetical protein CH247_28850 [Rhodococcus sp. 06-156-3b]OZD25160.1 hypothetical protein CH253_03885 [Rhodococcus sp. 06-156-3C]OZD40104.1 hypothetical protein CH284_03610 [Rhodococcus sp. 06-156-3]
MTFESTYADRLDALVLPWQGAEAPSPQLLVFNDALAGELRIPDVGVDVLSGATAPAGSNPVAMVYAGHQFGGYAPLLGDGRALLLGEVLVGDGRVDVHLKGSGPTPFSRGGDGFAVVGPMLREYLISEAMHALAIPTTRSLAVTATGRDVYRNGPEPGAVLTRIAASHIRVGTFEFAVRRDGLVQPLADYAIERHYPAATGDYLAFFEAVVDAQASLVAKWMLAGFVHGVMNTDNTTISGQTIDYGPCAFIDGYDPAAVFSSIDQGGRYAFGNQPAVLKWNLARFGETLLRLISDVPDDAIAQVTAVLESFDTRYDGYFTAGMTSKLGLASPDRSLIDDFLAVLQAEGADWTGTFRTLADSLRAGVEPAGTTVGAGVEPAGTTVGAGVEPAGTTVGAGPVVPSWRAGWESRWRSALVGDPAAVADAMDRVNPVYIPRNHLVDAALVAATGGDMSQFSTLLDVVTHPFEVRPEWAEFAGPAPAVFASGFQTFCGT